MQKYIIISLSFFIAAIGSLSHQQHTLVYTADAQQSIDIVYPDFKTLLKGDTKLTALCMIESGYNPNALNPKDTDGLSKHGLFQYDYNSFYDVNKICNVLPDIELQEVANVINDPYVQVVLTRCAIENGQSWRWPKI